MDILQALLGEHGIFYAQFAFLEAEVTDIEEVATLHQLSAMLGAALSTHAALENELLFARLEERVGTIPPIVVMRMEHDQIEHNLNLLPQTRERKEVRTLLLETIALAREHFAKEEQVLFPMAANLLPLEDREALGRAWAIRRQVTLGDSG